jgi:hypothetical protein
MKTITEIQQQIEQLKQQILEAQQHTPPTYSSEHFSSKNVLMSQKIVSESQQVISNVQSIISNIEFTPDIEPILSNIQSVISNIESAISNIQPPQPPQPCVNHVIPINLCKIGMKRHNIKDDIENNIPIEENLHVIAVISNICLFKKRYQLIREFMRRMEFENNVILYVVELAYGNQPFAITKSNNPRHLQLRTKEAIWHKENMINLGVRKLLPPNWKAFAWIDSDVDFDSNCWALDTLKILNGAKDIVQIFSHAVDMDQNEETMNVYNSFSFQFCHGLPYSNKFPNYWHPGYAWACTRKAYEQMGCLFELGILGASDHIMSFCLTNKGVQSVNEKYSEDFKNKILEFQNRVKRLRLGYVPVTSRHFFHGSKANRKYIERNEILLRYNYSPSIHITYDSNGIMIPSPNFPKEFLDEIMNYFKQRNEDE